MKRWLAAGAAILLLAVFLLSRTAISAEAFTGQWYANPDGHLYVFSDGIISCEAHQFITLDGAPMSGAYAFTKDAMVLFTIGVDGLENVKMIYLVEQGSGDVLCENPDGSGQVYFSRVPIA